MIAGPEGFTAFTVKFAVTGGRLPAVTITLAAPILYASSGQTSAIVPYEVAGKTSTVVTVQYQGTASAGVTLAVTSSELGLFTANTSGSGQGAILNQDLSVNSASNPAAAGSIIVLYGTGEGQTSPAGVDGQAAINTFPKPLQPITATVGGMAATVLYYGAAPTLVAGALQVNVQLPAGLPAGNAVVQIAEGSVQSPSTVTVAVKGQ